jgi:putative phosphoesterase
VTRARRVAVVGDVHGNAVALEAVLAELSTEDVDLVVWMGDLSWGSEPTATLDLVRSLEVPSLYVRGNAERMLLELRDGTTAEPTERERWMLASHTSDDLELVSTFRQSHSVEIEGLGATYFTHGSPRSDEELLTEATPEARVREATRELAERVLVTGHTHVRYDRAVGGVRALNPGSVGLPYEGERGAFWAFLGPDVEHRRTEYDVEEAVARMRATDDPRVEPIVEMMLEPPARDGAIEHAERLELSG